MIYKIDTENLEDLVKMEERESYIEYELDRMLSSLNLIS